MAVQGIVKRPFRTALSKNTGVNGFGIPTTVALTAGQFVEIGRVTIQAGQALKLGFGGFEGQDSATGRFYFDLKDSSTAPGVSINGMFRIDAHNASDRPMMTVFEARTETLRTNPNDRTVQIPFPGINAIATEDWAFVIKIKSDATATVGAVNSTLLMDATSYEAK